MLKNIHSMHNKICTQTGLITKFIFDSMTELLIGIKTGVRLDGQYMSFVYICSIKIDWKIEH